MVEKKCDICEVPYRKHPECEACGILVGPGHISGGLKEFRGYKICNECKQYWKKLENLMGKEVLLEQIGHLIPKCLSFGAKKDEQKEKEDEDERQGAEAEY